jgi:hypothetical protein
MHRQLQVMVRPLRSMEFSLRAVDQAIMAAG